MCLISIAPKGSDKTSKQFIEWIERGAENNDDGHGYCYKKDGEKVIHFKKGLFIIDDFIKEIRDLNLKPEDELIVHSRIGNVGSITNQNCHPFIISQNTEEIIKLEGTTKNPMVAHNGTFSDFKREKSEYSDTHHFIKEILGIPEIKSLLKRDEVDFYTIINKLVGTYNKLAFMLPNDNAIFYIGDFKKEEGGYYFSNDGYKRSNFVNRGGVTHYPGYEDNDNEEWRDEDYYGRKKRKRWDEKYDNYGFPKQKDFNFPDPSKNNIIGYKFESKLDILSKNKKISTSVKPLMSSSDIELTENNYEHFIFWIPDIDSSNTKYFIDNEKAFLIKPGYSANTDLLLWSEFGKSNINYQVSKKLIEKICWFTPKKEYREVYIEYMNLLEAMKIDAVKRTPSKNSIKKLLGNMKSKQNRVSNRYVEYQGKKYHIYNAILFLEKFSSSSLVSLTKSFIAFGKLCPVDENIIDNTINEITREEDIKIIKLVSDAGETIVDPEEKFNNFQFASQTTEGRITEVMDHYCMISREQAIQIVDEFENPENHQQNREEAFTEVIPNEELHESDSVLAEGERED